MPSRPDPRPPVPADLTILETLERIAAAPWPPDTTQEWARAALKAYAANRTPADLTTLQVCRWIADAVALALLPPGAAPNRHRDDTRDPATQAVIAALDATGTWLCRRDAEDVSADPADVDLPFEDGPV